MDDLESVRGQETRLSGYPRPDRGLKAADRLAALASAYFGMSVPYAVTMLYAACLLAYSALNGSLAIFFDGHLTIIFAFYSLPFLAAILSWFPLSKLVKGAGWSSFRAGMLTAAIPLYMLAIFFFYPARGRTYSDIPWVESFSDEICILVLSVLVFPALRSFIAFELFRGGLPFRFLLRGPKRVRQEIERIRADQAVDLALELSGAPEADRSWMSP